MMHSKKSVLIPVVVVAMILLAISPAAAVVVRGYNAANLIGGDLTDPENNINDSVQLAPYYVTGYNFVSASASNENWFSTNPAVGGRSEAFLDLFDNKVGGGEAKYCCNGGTQWVQVELAGPYSLTTFTITSDNDSGTGRDPDVWQILGSNDGSTFTPIFTYNVDGTSPFSLGGGSVDNKVLQYDLGVDFFNTTPYKYFRFAATSYGTSNALGLSELEFFGVPEPSTVAMLLGLGAVGVLGYLKRRRR